MRYLILMTAFFAMMALPVMAAQQFEIAATVNKDAISKNDVQSRMKLFFASTGLRDTPKNRQEAYNKVLDILIDEQLRIQEAQRRDLAVTAEEIDQGFAALAAQNNLEAEQFEQALASQKIDKSTLLQKIKAQAAWSKVVQSHLRPQINVSENDVDAKMERIKRDMGKKEYRTAEIFLPIPSEDKEANIKEMGTKLVEEIRGGRAPFQMVAAQFSQSESAAKGGDMGWVREGQLPKELDLVLKSLNQGQISPPIKGLNGYHIMTVIDERVVSEETMPAEEDILNGIGLERLDRMQQRYLADLKSAAFIQRKD